MRFWNVSNALDFSSCPYRVAEPYQTRNRFFRCQFPLHRPILPLRLSSLQSYSLLALAPIPIVTMSVLHSSPSYRTRVPAFSHSQYGFSLSSLVPGDEHFLWSWPIIPHLKHHPTRRLYLKAAWTSSPSGLIIGPPQWSGLFNGTSIRS